MDITGKVFIVTGGASGLGEGTARLISARGGKVVIADLQADKGEAVAKSLGGKFVRCDVTQESDGQAVVVPFAHVNIDVVPAFLLKNGRHWICDSSGGGGYRETDAAAELNALDLADSMFNGCARPLIRMAKQWQRYCNVDIKSFMLERLVIELCAGPPSQMGWGRR